MFIIVVTFKLGCPFNVVYNDLVMSADINGKYICSKFALAQVCGLMFFVIRSFLDLYNF